MSERERPRLSGVQRAWRESRGPAGRVVAMLALFAVPSCGPSLGARSVSTGPSPLAQSGAVHASSARVGRWVVLANPGRTSGRFVTAMGGGPSWPLDVAGNARWSDDGRWLVSCGSDFVAARWMGSARPSRIEVSSGGCQILKWAPSGDRALVLSKAPNQARLLAFTPGARPAIQAESFEIALTSAEKLAAWEYLEWSPMGDGFLVSVREADGRSSIRWVDALSKPGTTRRLLTANGFEARPECWWAPNGKRVACRSSAPPREGDSYRREALSLFEIEHAQVSGRTLLEAPWFDLSKLSWLDQDRLVFQDRDATRLLNVSGAELPLTLSATANEFAVAPSAPRVAYLNHRGLCLRGGGDRLGPEQLVVPGQWKGLQWSRDGRSLLAQRADQRVELVVTEAGSEQQRVRQTPEVQAAAAFLAGLSAGGTLLLTRQLRGQPTTSEASPLQIWSLADLAPRRLLPPDFGDVGFDLSPDDAALVARRAGQPPTYYLGLLRNDQTTLQSLGEAPALPWVSWQPGRAIEVSETPAPPLPSDPHRERVALAASHPITLATAYVEGARKCSAALIDPYFVVTAHHCVEDPERPVRVVLGRGLSWQREFSVPPYRILHHPKVRYLANLDLSEYDLALIELPEPAPAEARPFTLARVEDGVVGSEIFLAGYGGDHSVGLCAQPELRYGISRLEPAAGIAGALAWRSADGAENAGCFGDSGGPVLVRRGDGSFALLAIHFGSGGSDFTLACGTSGTGGNLAAERAWLNDALDKLSISRRGSGPPRHRANPL